MPKERYVLEITNLQGPQCWRKYDAGLELERAIINKEFLDNAINSIN